MCAPLPFRPLLTLAPQAGSPEGPNVPPDKRPCIARARRLTAEAGVVVIRRDPAGLVTLPPRSCVPVPAALRHRCGLLPGDPVLLTAVPAEDTLTAYSLAVVDQALAALIPFPALDIGSRPGSGCRQVRHQVVELTQRRHRVGLVEAFLELLEGQPGRRVMLARAQA